MKKSSFFLISTVFSVICLFYSLSFSQVNYIFKNLNDVRVIKGVAILSHSQAGYSTPGSIVIAEPKTHEVLIKIGDMFPVKEGTSYLFSSCIKPFYLYRCHAYAVVVWYNSSGAEVGSMTTAAIYTASARPHRWEPMPPLWMEYSVAGVAPVNATHSQIFIELQNNNVPRAGSRPRSPGMLIVDDVSVTRSPKIEITTGEPGNLVFESTPFPLSISVSDIPEEMSDLVLSGGIYDVWGNEKIYDSVEIGREGIQEKYSVPELPRGYYEIRWQLKSHDRVVRKGTVSAGVIPDPNKRTFAEGSPFALDAGFSWFYITRGEDVLRIATEAARRIGMRDLRERMSTGEVNPAPGVFNWGKYERAAKSQFDAGIKILEIIHNEPEWLSSAENGQTNVPPKNLTGIYNFFKQGTKDLGKYLQYWESWNEPDGGFFIGRPEEFAGLQKAAYLGALAGNPDVKVTSSSFCVLYGWWADGVFQNGVKDYFDIFNLHYYGNGNEDGVLNWIQKFRDGLAQYGLSQPWWMTEMGMTCFWDSTGSSKFSEIQQAKKLVKSFVYNVSEGFEKFHYFYMAEFLESDQDMWGIFRENLTPKPAFIALANLTNVLDKGEYLGKFDLGVPGSQGYVFNNGKEQVLVAWADEQKNIRINGQNLRAVDMIGYPVSSSQISPNPIYIFGADISSQSLTGKPVERKPYTRPDTKSLSLLQMIQGVVPNDYPFSDRRRKEPLPIEDGKPFEVHLTLCNFWDEPLSVSSEWNLPQGWTIQGRSEQTVQLSPMEEKIVICTVAPMNLETNKEYSIRVESTAPGRKIAPVVMKLKKRV